MSTVYAETPTSTVRASDNAVVWLAELTPPAPMRQTLKSVMLPSDEWCVVSTACQTFCANSSDPKVCSIVL